MLGYIQSFKGTYLGLLNEMYSGNDGMINMLREFGGIPADALSALSGTFSDAADSLDRFAGRTGTAAAAVQSVSGALNEVAGADISSPIGQFDALGSSVDNTAASISGGTAPKAGVPSGKADGADGPGTDYGTGNRSYFFHKRNSGHSLRRKNEYPGRGSLHCAGKRFGERYTLL